MEESKEVGKRIEKIKNWFRNPYNLTLVGILILAIIIRIYYFIFTKGQTLWWDEAEYMSAAKLWAFDVPYDLNPQRPPLFQFLSALSFMIGLGEQFIKFTWVLLPSVFLVFVIYLLGKEMYNKRIGLIAAFLSAVSWTFIFWTARIQPDFLSMSFSVLGFLFMWKYWKNPKTKLIIWAGIFAALGLYFKVSALLVPLSIGFFILIKDRLSAFKNKHYYLYASSFILTLTPYFIWSYLIFNDPLGFRTGYSNALINPTPFAWYTLRFFYGLTENILFILFILGIVLALRFFFYFDILIKNKKKCFHPDIFGLVVLIIISAFYIFYIRGADDRWVFLWLPFIFFLIGNALLFIYNMIKKYSKVIAIAIVLALLLFGGYMQYTHADSLIEHKKTSYLPVKLSGIWIKENSNPGDRVLSTSYTQHVYYTERHVTTYNPMQSKEELTEFINKNHPRYMVFSIFEAHPSWTQEWINENINILNPAKVYYLDLEETQASLIIYEIQYENQVSNMQ